ncbi:MAG: MBL fold metallo-hydrolase [Candidatus Hodarchaeota archaeon]
MDHLSLPDIEAIVDNETLFYAPEPTPIDRHYIPAEQLLELPATEINYVEPSDIIETMNIALEFVPSYNIDKYNPEIPGQLWHPPEAKWVGVIIDFGKGRIYQAGDSDHVPEMAQVRAYIAFLPLQGGARWDLKKQQRR